MQTVQDMRQIQAAAKIATYFQFGIKQCDCGCGGFFEVVLLDTDQQPIAVARLDKETAGIISNQLAILACRPAGEKLQ